MLKGREFKDQKKADAVVNKGNTIGPIKPEFAPGMGTMIIERANFLIN